MIHSLRSRYTTQTPVPPLAGQEKGKSASGRTALLAALLLLAFHPTARADTPPALYTSDQAKAGAQKFTDNCEQCHGTHLEGRAGPALKGPNFASPKSAFTVSDIFTIVSQNMPASQPGSLQPNDYVQVMAFLLQQNGYPAGTSTLTFDGAGASKVPLLYHGP